LTVVVGFFLGWGNVADGFEDSAVVEPVDPFQGGVFDGVEVLPRSLSSDDIGLVEADDRLGHGVVIGIPDRAD
jgi:hypothetical protein